MCKRIFKKAKNGKIFENLGKNVQNFKTFFKKGQVIACDYRTQ